jgi:hypothetical protein
MPPPQWGGAGKKFHFVQIHGKDRMYESLL